MKRFITGSYAEFSQLAAEDLVQLTANKNAPVVCTASGDTPAGLYKALFDKVKVKHADVQDWYFIGLDEWLGIPPENEGSCRFFFESLLLKPLNFASSQIHLFDAMSPNPLQECRKMDQLILAKGGIDLMIVGVGMNGHIGFNEPGVSFSNYSHVIDLDETTISVGQKYFKGPVVLMQGITLGLKHLVESKKVFLIANGVAPRRRHTLAGTHTLVHIVFLRFLHINPVYRPL